MPPFSPACPVPLNAVQQGDFVYGIASMFRVTVANLLAVNSGMQATTLLQVRWRLLRGHSAVRRAAGMQPCAVRMAALTRATAPLQAGMRVKIPPFDSTCGNGKGCAG